MKIAIIAAVSENNVIGFKGKIPWHLPEDLKRFKKITMGHHIIMGRKTFESIRKPLPGRINIVITRNQKYKAKGCITAFSLDEALQIARKNGESEVFVIGGASVYIQATEIGDKIYITKINKEYKGDTFFPKIKKSKWKIVSRKIPQFKAKPTMEFVIYKHI